jgi:hypothetical protein
LPKEQDLWQEALIDTWTQLAASPACNTFTKEEMVINVTDDWARKWLKRDPIGQRWALNMNFEEPFIFAPKRECRSDDPRPKLEFTIPRNGETIRESLLRIYGIADATAWFDNWELSFGHGNDPNDWDRLEADNRPLGQPDVLYEWDLVELPAGEITLRLRMESTEGTYAEVKIIVNLQVPTPTPTPTPTETLTPTPTETLLPSVTPTITNTPTPSPTNPPPTATETLTPEPTATETPLPTVAPP